jgi:uncharacterized protein (TIGR00730 family)
MFSPQPSAENIHDPLQNSSADTANAASEPSAQTLKCPYSSTGVSSRLLGYEGFGIKKETSTSCVVYCSSYANLPQEWIDIALKLTEALHAEGITLVNGGGGGLMEIMSNRMLELGGNVELVCLEGLSGPRDYHLHPRTRLQWATSMPQRRCMLSAASDMAIALCGGPGTLEEVAEYWASRKLRWHARPLLLLNHNGFWAPLAQQVRMMAEVGTITAEEAQTLVCCDTLEDALEAVRAAAGQAQVELKEVECKARE